MRDISEAEVDRKQTRNKLSYWVVILFCLAIPEAILNFRTDIGHRAQNVFPYGVMPD
jgi:hypothetical protein